MANKMLIDSSHPEETRVVVTRGNKVEEFDFESASRRQLRGNIYLAKVTRVEPSLQAAFVDYGGNRHGFLAFSEIHPDYYQIPVADRQALLEEEERAEREAEREAERPRGRRRRGASRRRHERDATVSARPEEFGQESEGETRPADEAAAFAGGGDAGSEDELGSGNGEAQVQPTGEAEPAGAVASEQPGAAEADTGSVPSDIEVRPVEPADAGAPVAAAETEQAPTSGEPADGAAAPNPAAGEPASGDVETLADASAPFEADTARATSDDDEEEDEEEDEDGEENDDDDDDDDELEEHEIVEQVGGGDALEEVPERPRIQRRHYKIQEVIKRRQILLVQVVKEERGNKGAALTTYLSLAGRYAVLMPNTGKGGGISRKITNAEDRKRLKEVVQDLEVPDGMGIILRTAGANRTKQEIKRDFEYLMRLWESVRELTLSSSAPALVYEEGSLVKRAIRDLYNKDIDEVVVAGEEAYREAKDFMRMIMPSQTKAVRLYREPQPLFAQYGVEAQLDAMFSNHVTLKSGGYLVINPTEALVSIDVNSGRSTREHNIEDTALRTNLEAAEEIARQLRLRDLAGLIVIDFIDMEEKRNNRAVEKKLKECLKNDRARIQVGRISPFGLLEMSRQRIRTGVLESSSVVCQHCGGSGFVRSTPSVALQILRSIEESLLRSATHNLIVRTRAEAAFYILNQKRGHLRDIETRFGITVTVVADDSLSGSVTFAIDRGEPATPAERRPSSTGVRMETVTPVDEPIEIEPTLEYEREEEEEAEADASEPASAASEEAGAGENGRRRRRRRRRRGRGPREFEAAQGQGESSGEEDEEEGDEEDEASGTDLRAASAAEEVSSRREEDDDEVVATLPRYEDQPATGSSAHPEYAPDRPQSQPDAIHIETSPGAHRSTVGEVAEEPAQPQAAAEPEPEPVAIVLTPPDPNRPKRGGWWSKAKAALGGS
ncbi:Rne/Rng family ribonuclease [Enterovirga aerilata]|uniref:Ribonuclease E n=1 Tax=Enterovirga aerilata TaxID=2730920 RepID=A0A849IDS1_9HYPH|nr:ribonuclease E/G [Enterovirga sp. DB1703]NNM74589.1 Rne/Rng family ribonuclease [Enterovirga sp. DB1703]